MTLYGLYYCGKSTGRKINSKRLFVERLLAEDYAKEFIKGCQEYQEEIEDYKITIFEYEVDDHSLEVFLSTNKFLA